MSGLAADIPRYELFNELAAQSEEIAKLKAELATAKVALETVKQTLAAEAKIKPVLDLLGM